MFCTKKDEKIKKRIDLARVKKSRQDRQGFSEGKQESSKTLGPAYVIESAFGTCRVGFLFVTFVGGPRRYLRRCLYG